MPKLIISTSQKQYPVIITPQALRKFKFPKSSIIITDQHLAKLYAADLKQFPVVSFPAGESHKRLNIIESLANQLAALDADRNTSLIAFGGGVVGDMVGFLASIYMRGIPVYQVPTTLLAMVDSSIGGKTGVDLKTGKNLLGTFYQPQAVIIDPQFLVSLSEEQFTNGMAEVIKHGIIHKPLFMWLEKNAKQIKKRDLNTLTRLIVKNIQVKTDHIAQDTFEKGKRKLLNLGHTFGHAIEQLSQYTILHGEAVAIGIMYAAAYADCQDIEHIQKLCYTFNLPTSLEQPYSSTQMIKAMATDKKHEGKYATLILPQAIGQVMIKPRVTAEQLKKFFTVCDLSSL